MAPSTVSVLIPCLVDQVYPEMGWAMVAVLRRLGYGVDYRRGQTCCGQPAFNAGHWGEARRVAGHCLEVFRGAERVVCPSGSCTAMLREFYAELFAGDAREAEAAALAGRVEEFSEFLLREGAAGRLGARLPGRLGFHNSCHSRRELGQRDESRRVLEQLEGCEVVEPLGEPDCCGFGGLFSVKFAGIAGAMAQSRLARFHELGVARLAVNDPGCILHLRQEAERAGLALEIRHVAEWVAEALGVAAAPGAGAER
ncbi:MAG TPA: (Fe-S)-binding protein [Candidatus Sumerlaeota bacterium]|nr:(Fe-S)-binding protein [Candidatus Sumerlaeota bacterium]HPK03494.1 (Fe-S)-binding protein [Candidatus Sumerlaeota bacterium]